MNSKKRLEAYLTLSERRALVLALLRDVLSAATNSRLSDKTLLVTPDSEIISLIQQWNFPKIEFLLEPAEGGINQAVQLALNWCQSKPITSLLIIPADLPLITSETIDELLKLGNAGCSIIIVPSQRKDGTNAFYQRPPNNTQIYYGVNSYQKNLEFLSQKNLTYTIFENPAFALDIDLKEDIAQLKNLKLHSTTSEFIKTLELHS